MSYDAPESISVSSSETKIGCVAIAATYSRALGEEIQFAGHTGGTLAIWVRCISGLDWGLKGQYYLG